jgi:hypothetical protein
MAKKPASTQVANTCGTAEQAAEEVVRLVNHSLPALKLWELVDRAQPGMAVPRDLFSRL